MIIPPACDVTFKLIDLEQGTPEWHEFRRSHIGASNCAAILGKSQYKSPYMVWEEMVLGKKTFSTAAMERGKSLEPVARQLISSKHGVDYSPIVLISKERGWQMASMDCWKDGKGAEIKCPGERTFIEISAAHIPDDYLWQVQHQMSVNGLENQSLFVYHPDYDPIEINILRDEDMIEALNIKENEFYHQFVLEFTPPPLTELDVVVREDVKWNEAAANYRRCKELADEYEAAVQRHKKALISLSNGLNCRGSGITLTKVVSQGRVDYNAIPELKDLDLDQYRKPSVESWRITT